MGERWFLAVASYLATPTTLGPTGGTRQPTHPTYLVVTERSNHAERPATKWFQLWQRNTVGSLAREADERRVVGLGFYVRVAFVALLLAFTWWVMLWVRDYRPWIVSINLLLAGGMLGRRTFGVCTSLGVIAFLPEAGLALVSMTR